MIISAQIRKNATGEVRTYEETCELERLDTLPFHWGEGNNACDCNRHLYFCRAAKEIGETDIPNFPCGDTAYSVLSITDHKGKLLYADPK